MRFRTLLLSLAFLAAGAPPSGAGQGDSKDIFPLSQVKKGQKGYGLTVFQGTVPERFEFEVLGVAKRFLPTMDIILVKSDDPKLLESGFAQGMSGSPLFIDGKIACAFSYAFPFSKTAIGGCTPIEYMLADSKQNRRGPEATALASNDEWHRYAGGEPPPRTPWIAASPLPTPAKQAEPTLVRAGVPLSVAGLGPTAFNQARELFEPYGLEPMQGIGGGGDPTAGPTRFELGAPLGVQLVTGDISINATGTVSYVDGPTVIAFGHPMFGFGESYLPVTSAEIHAIIPSVRTAFKLSSPLRSLGSLVQDRAASIVADTSKTADMIPVDIKIKNQEGEKVFHSEVIRQRFLTPQLAMLAVQSAVQVLAPDKADATLTLKSTLHLKGYDPLVFTDYLYSTEGLSADAIGGARALRALVPLLFNPFSPVRIERLELDADVSFTANVAEIRSIRVPEVELPTGKETYVEVVLRPYADKEYTVRIPFTVPARLRGSTLKIEVVPGDVARPDVAPPESLDDVMAALKKTLPANTLVATLYTPDEGITLAGKVLPNLPDSALDTARPAASTRRADVYKSIARAVVPSRRVVVGKQELVVKVADER